MMFHCSSTAKESRFSRIRTAFTGQIKLLCIEDNVPLGNLICEDFFSSPVFHAKAVDTIETAKSAIFSKVRHHCWLMDLTLEKRNDALELLKKKPHFPYCIVMSGSQSLHDATMAIREGAYGAFDKVEIFTANPHEFIKEACSLSVMSYLLNAARPERLEMFFILLKEHVQSSEEWAKCCCLNERMLRDICEDDSGLTTRQFLNFYHVLNAIVLSDCIIEGMEGCGAIRSELERNAAFYEKCAENVMRDFNLVYGPRFLGVFPGRTVRPADPDAVLERCPAPASL